VPLAPIVNKTAQLTDWRASIWRSSDKREKVVRATKRRRLSRNCSRSAALFVARLRRVWHRHDLGVCRTRWNVGLLLSKKPNRTELTSKFKNRKLCFCSYVFKNRLRRFGDGFPRCLIRNYSSSDMIGSPVKGSKNLSSCRISTVLSHFSWQVVGPIQHGSMSFLASYRKGRNERCRCWTWQTNVKKNRKNRNRNSVKLKSKRKSHFLQNWTENWT